VEAGGADAAWPSSLFFAFFFGGGGASLRTTGVVVVVGGGSGGGAGAGAGVTAEGAASCAVASSPFRRFFSCLASYLAISCSVGTRPSFALSFVTLLDSDSDIPRADGAHCLK
jgi:hypothetical protein